MVHRYGHDVVLRMGTKYYHLYVEKYDRHEKVLLLDFVREYEFGSFLEYFDLGDAYNRIGSMMLLQLPQTWKTRVREGVLYKVPVEELLKIHWTPESHYDDAAPALIGFSVNLQRENDEQNFSYMEGETFHVGDLFRKPVSLTASFRHHIVSKGHKSECHPLNLLRGDLELVVKNTGQGSWNEIRVNGRCKVVFDMGTSMYASAENCRKLLENTYWDKAGFCKVTAPQIYMTVLKNLPNGYEFANKVDIGGKSGSEWVIGGSTWVSKIYAPGGKLLRTGY